MSVPCAACRRGSVVAVTDTDRTHHWERWLAKLRRAWHSSSPERDEAEAQEYWRRRFREHPEELSHSSTTGPLPVAQLVSGPAPGAQHTGSTSKARKTIALWLNLTFALLQGVATLVLFILGASSDKIELGIAWTALWSLQAGLFVLRYG